MKRAEFDWSEVPYPDAMPGHADAVPGSLERAAGVLWVPDPEQRRGWREWYVAKHAAKAERAVGFRKPGAR